MNKLKEWITEEESGQGLVEYALIIVLISVAVVAALKGLSKVVEGKFDQISGILHRND